MTATLQVFFFFLILKEITHAKHLVLSLQHSSYMINGREQHHHLKLKNHTLELLHLKNIDLVSPSLWFFFSFFFFFAFQGCMCGIWKFPGQGESQSYSSWLMSQLRQHQMLSPLNEARNRIQILVNTSWILNPLSHNGISLSDFLIRQNSLSGNFSIRIMVQTTEATTILTMHGKLVLTSIIQAGKSISSLARLRVLILGFLLPCCASPSYHPVFPALTGTSLPRTYQLFSHLLASTFAIPLFLLPQIVPLPPEVSYASFKILLRGRFLRRSLFNPVANTYSLPYGYKVSVYKIIKFQRSAVQIVPIVEQYCIVCLKAC